MLISSETAMTKKAAQAVSRELGYYGLGTDAAWYEPRTLSDASRQAFSEMARKSARARKRALSEEPSRPINAPTLNPEILMPQLPSNGLRTLSLFSGGGGLDLGFDRAGFRHVASYEIVTTAAETLKVNRPSCDVFGGKNGDVRKADWR